MGLESSGSQGKKAQNFVKKIVDFLFFSVAETTQSKQMDNKDYYYTQESDVTDQESGRDGRRPVLLKGCVSEF